MRRKIKKIQKKSKLKKAAEIDFFDGHILPHFREDMNWFDGNIEGTIQKLNIDFE
jgi:hypothetical protein